MICDERVNQCFDLSSLWLIPETLGVLCFAQGHVNQCVPGEGMRCELHLGVCVVLSSASEYDCVQLMQSLQQTTLTSASRKCLEDHDSCVMEREEGPALCCEQ